MTWVLLALVVVGFLFFGKHMVGMKKELNALQPESLVRTNDGELVKRNDFRISQLETQVTLYNKQHSQLQHNYVQLEQSNSHLQQSYSHLQQDHSNLQQDHSKLRQSHLHLQQSHFSLQQDHLSLQNEFREYRVRTDKKIDELCETLRQSHIHTQNLEVILKEKEDKRRRIQ